MLPFMQEKKIRYFYVYAFAHFCKNKHRKINQKLMKMFAHHRNSVEITVRILTAECTFSYSFDF